MRWYYTRVHREHKILKIFMKLIGIFVISTMSIVLYDIYLNINVESIPEIKEDTPTAVEETENDICTTLEEVSNAVVGVSKLQSVDSSFFSFEAIETYNLGTGIIVSNEGYVITNYHVSGKKLSKCYITLEDGEEYMGQVVWTDPNLDLSIIKINISKQMNYAKLGDSDSLKIGQGVYAIGNPLGAEFQKTVTYGIVSALDRTIKVTDEEDNKSSYMEELIQTDASINAGNSGGPLVDTNGNIIGITTIKITDAEGIGFAIPINIIKPIIQKLESLGEYEEASLGVYVYDKEATQYLNSSLDFEYGVYVTELVSDGAGKTAGIRVGDIIQEIDGIRLNKINDLRRYIYTKNVEDEVNLKILRNRHEIELTAKLTKKT